MITMMDKTDMTDNKPVGKTLIIWLRSRAYGDAKLEVSPGTEMYKLMRFLQQAVDKIGHELDGFSVSVEDQDDK